MTDQKRDESRDLAYAVIAHKTVPWSYIASESPTWERYVPHGDLVAAEERYSKLSRLTAALVTALVDDNATFFGDSIVDATTVLQKELGI